MNLKPFLKQIITVTLKRATSFNAKAKPKIFLVENKDYCDPGLSKYGLQKSSKKEDDKLHFAKKLKFSTLKKIPLKK